MIKSVQKYCFCLLVVFFHGCASSPPGQQTIQSPLIGKTWEVSEKAYSMNVKKFEQSIISDLDGINDVHGRKYALSVIRDYTGDFGDHIDFHKAYYGTNICDEKIQEANEQTRKFLGNLGRFIRYTLRDNSATGTDIHPRMNYEIEDLLTNSQNAIHKNVKNKFLIKRNMHWEWGKTAGGRESGYGSIAFAVGYTCNPQSLVGVSIEIKKGKVENPTTILFKQKIADIWIDWESLERSLNSVSQSSQLVEDNKQKHENFKNIVIAKINKSLRDRYSLKKDEKIKFPERTIDIPFDVAVSRIQRKLDQYVYDASNSTFTFSRKYQMSGYSLSSKVESRIKVFPEKKGQSVLIYEFTYEPILDKLSNQIIFDKFKAKKYAELDFLAIESMLLN